MSTSSDGGVTWGAAVIVNSNATTVPAAADSFPTIVFDGIGGWFAAWHSSDTLGGTLGTDDDILCAISYDLGATWTPAESISRVSNIDAGPDRFVNVATDRAGRFVPVWQAQQAGFGLGPDFDVLEAPITCTCPP